MLTIEPTGAVLGATARGIDLARPLSDRSLGQILLALGRYGVLRFPDQHLDLGELKRFSEQFGKIQGPATRGHDPAQEYPEIDILSNLKQDGRYIGSPDAGQDWHIAQRSHRHGDHDEAPPVPSIQRRPRAGPSPWR